MASFPSTRLSDHQIRHPSNENSPMLASPRRHEQTSSTCESHQSGPQHQTYRYSTFTNNNNNDKPTQQEESPSLKKDSLISRLCHKLVAGRNKLKSEATLNDTNVVLEPNTWRAIILISLAVALVACLHGQADYYISPTWHFDYNVYIPKGGDSGALRTRRISLIAQVVLSRSLQRLADISSRPNRAYAKEWGMDYVLYDSGRGAVGQRSCFDKVNVLNTIMDRQRKGTNDSPPLWPLRERVPYESILLLQPDSVITELDTNIFDSMLPPDKLAAISGWDVNMTLRSNSGIVVFNMQHEYAEIVAKLWLEMTLPKDETCGDNNDLEMLIIAISSIMEENEKLENFLEPLDENRIGFVGDHLIKSTIPMVPGSRSTYLMKSLEESKAALQETVDSVCYRFYPKCEVV